MLITVIVINKHIQAFYDKLGPRTWLAISSATGTVAYFIMYLAYYIDIKESALNYRTPA